MLSIYEIKDYIDEFINNQNIKINTIIDYSIPYLMCYNRKSNIIKINCNTRLFYNNAKEIEIQIKEFLVLCASHEIGHYLDTVGKGRLEREENAYELGMQYVPNKLKKKFREMNERNLNIYEGKHI